MPLARIDPPPASTPADAGPPPGFWARQKRRHLFDYNAAALRLWLTVALGGGVATLWALSRIGELSAQALVQVQLGIAFVMLAAWFPVHLPRTKYSISVADVFIFALLALHGAPAAVLAAATEGVVGSIRTTRRLTSRVSTPAAAAMAMGVCGLGFGALHALLVDAGVAESVATLMALCTIALPYFAAITLPLLTVVAVKNGKRVSLRLWAQDYGWFGAIQLLSAAVAGVLAMNARQFGPAVVAVAAAVAAAVVAMVRLSLRRHETEHQAQEARIALAQREAEVSRQRFTAAFTHAAIGMALVRPDGRIEQVNQALCALLGRQEGTLLNRPFDSLLHPGDAELLRRRANPADAAASHPVSMELRCRHLAGQDIWVSLHCGHFIDPASDHNGLIYQLHDITSRRLAEGELQHIAYHDSLTDLANRSCFNERLGVAVERSRTDPESRFAVLFLDLDRFKVVNDSLGHVGGNTLLREVARRLSENVRPGDLVARLGGDEFAVLLEQVDSPDDATQLAQRLLATLSAPIIIMGTEVAPGASIGITFSDLGYRIAEEVLRDADLAMYAAKGEGRGRVALFDHSMHERIAEKLKLEGDLRRAIGEGQLSVVYQPLFELESRRLNGVEALVRWMHPERGPISPQVFINLAEESGHIEALTAWVMEQAVSQMARWQRSFRHASRLVMHVNISGRDLGNDALVPLVRDVLQRHALAPGQLALEITETMLMTRLTVALAALQSLREVGVKISIDDFGTGYSSLAYLSTLPIDSLKIDRSFVSGMDDGQQNIEIVRAVLNLGRSLGKKVIAEGIETVEQLTTLKELGVPVGQGYLLSRPLRADQLGDLLRANELQGA